jgi:hypothetical protein
MIEKKMPYEFRHIVKMSKDLVNISSHSVTKTDGATSLQCAASQTPFNGLSKFVVGDKCGCLISEHARSTLGDDGDKNCVACNQEMGEPISVNQSTEE